MGQDIHGWVEVAWDPPDGWAAVIDIGILVERWRGLWGWLLQEWGPFPSVAPRRGVPSDASGRVQQDIERAAPLIATGEVHSFTWITWTEIETIDWGVSEYPGMNLDVTVIESAVEGDGIRRSRNDERVLHTRRVTFEGYPGWTLLFDLMRRLAQEYGPDRVRLVVWFDA